MKVIVTGGLGFVGRSLARSLAERGRLANAAIDALVLADRVSLLSSLPDVPASADVVDVSTGDWNQVVGLFDRGDVCVFHLASIVSGEGEVNFDGAIDVNLDGTRHMLEACRSLGSRPRLIFTSSFAVFGGTAMPETVTDGTKQTPETTYGMTKAACELLINEYTRKGFLDGRTARLPTVIVRPGAPNAAASSFASAVFREPLAGIGYALPVTRDVRMPVIGVRTVVECLIRLAEVDGDALGVDRAVNLPSISVTTGEMIESLLRVAGDRLLGELTIEPDPIIERIVGTWPRFMSFERALALGLPHDDSLDEIVRAYIDDYVS